MSRLLRAIFSLAISIATLILLIRAGAIIWLVPYLTWHVGLALNQLRLLWLVVKRRPDLFTGDQSTVIRRARELAVEISKLDQ
jgi:hypothetical protein